MKRVKSLTLDPGVINLSELYSTILLLLDNWPSENATVGIYFWKKGKDYVECAESMINKNIRVNNEFYVCPVYNEAILKNAKIKTFHIEKMWGLGTPEDLDTFLKYDIYSP